MGDSVRQKMSQLGNPEKVKSRADTQSTPNIL